MRVDADNIAVIGGGPVGAAVSRALGDAWGGRPGRVLWFEANRPLQDDFSRMAIACPWAAGQVLAHSFEPGTLSSRIALRSREILIGLNRAGYIAASPRPWLACARRHAAPVDDAVRETLETAWRDGRMEGCHWRSPRQLSSVSGLSHPELEFAICDEEALAVDPRAFAVGMARWAAECPHVTAHFGARVLRIDGNELWAEQDEREIRARVCAVLLCVGTHAARENANPLQLDGRPIQAWIPPARLTHLHVFDHRSTRHVPTVTASVAGAATIARYEVFGDTRHGIRPWLPQAVRDFDINPLLTDVPGLCRLLDTHFDSRADAEANTSAARDAIAEQLKQLIPAELLPGQPGGKLPITETGIAAYIRHDQPDGEPTLRWLDTSVPTLYVQPANGRGLTQSAGLGEYAARLMLEK